MRLFTAGGQDVLCQLYLHVRRRQGSAGPRCTGHLRRSRGPGPCWLLPCLWFWIFDCQGSTCNLGPRGAAAPALNLEPATRLPSLLVLLLLLLVDDVQFRLNLSTFVRLGSPLDGTPTSLLFSARPSCHSSDLDQDRIPSLFVVLPPLGLYLLLLLVTDHTSIHISHPTPIASSRQSRPSDLTFPSHHQPLALATTPQQQHHQQQPRPCLQRKRTSATLARRTGSSRAAFSGRTPCHRRPLRAVSTRPSTSRASSLFPVVPGQRRAVCRARLTLDIRGAESGSPVPRVSSSSTNGSSRPPSSVRNSLDPASAACPPARNTAADTRCF